MWKNVAPRFRSFHTVGPGGRTGDAGPAELWPRHAVPGIQGPPMPCHSSEGIPSAAPCGLERWHKDPSPSDASPHDSLSERHCRDISRIGRRIASIDRFTERRWPRDAPPDFFRPPDGRPSDFRHQSRGGSDTSSIGRRSSPPCPVRRSPLSHGFRVMAGRFPKSVEAAVRPSASGCHPGASCRARFGDVRQAGHRWGSEILAHDGHHMGKIGEVGPVSRQFRHEKRYLAVLTRRIHALWIFRQTLYDILAFRGERSERAPDRKRA